MPERGRSGLLWTLAVILLLFQIACLERQGGDFVKYLGRIGVLAALTFCAGRHRGKGR